MLIKPRLFGAKKPDGPKQGRIQQTLAQTATAIAARPNAPNLPRLHRAMVYREAYVIYESGYRRMGIVLDYSANGARLRFPTNERLPPEVILHAGAVGVEGRARVVWQHNSEAGLALIPDTEV